jgi:penicillin-binding protein 1C
MGIAGNYVIGVWIGNFDGRGNPAFVGRDAAGPLLFSIVDAIRTQDAAFQPYPVRVATETRKVKVCAVSGDLPGPFCKVQKSAGFIPGKSPIHTCQIHRPVQIDAETGLRLCPGTPPPAQVKTEVFEFWPSDLLSLFERAGIPRRVPPPYPVTCAAMSELAQGPPPEITSPKQNLAYVLRLKAPGQPARIPLSAIVDADVRELYWFSDGDFLGRAAARRGAIDADFQWVPKAGKHVIRVVDDHGRAAAREVAVVVTGD